MESMAVINLRRDGSVIEDLSKITIQDDAVYALIRAMNIERGRKDEEGNITNSIRNSDDRVLA